MIPDNPSGENISAQLGIKNLNPRPQQYGFPSVGGISFSGIGPYTGTSSAAESCFSIAMC